LLQIWSFLVAFARRILGLLLAIGGLGYLVNISRERYYTCN
jgi:hypothetical protein